MFAAKINLVLLINGCQYCNRDVKLIMNIIITGASSGIGYQTALRLSRKEHNKVFVLSRNEEGLNRLVELSKSEQAAGVIIPLVIDIAANNFKELIDLLQANHIDHVDVLIHNAGQLITAPFESLKLEDWQTVYRTNVFAVAMLTQALMPLMGGKRHTHIIGISSIGGVQGSLKFPGLSAYSSSKGAMLILLECLAEEFKGRNIDVNCLALGAVQTEMLSKAFPGYQAPLDAVQMAEFIAEFSEWGWKYFKGKVLPVSVSNP
jgi:NAD(P)-dependent dehydrogenase (short-subunit alcohol dehydrogenase family)